MRYAKGDQENGQPALLAVIGRLVLLCLLPFGKRSARDREDKEEKKPVAYLAQLLEHRLLHSALLEVDA